MRLSGLLQTLEKLHGTFQSWTEDDRVQVRNTLTKILQYIRSQDKSYREWMVKHYTTAVQTVLDTPKLTNEDTVMRLTLDIISELIGNSGSSNRVAVLVQHNLSESVFQLMTRSTSTEVMIISHNIIIKLANKDRKIATKARLTGVLRITIGLVKNHIKEHRTILPFVTVLKICSSSTVNSALMGKENVIEYLFKIANSCGQKYTMLLKFSLEALSILVKNKSNAARLIGNDSLPCLLNLFVFWQKFEVSKPRFVNIRRALLRILKRVAMLKQARMILNKNGALEILFNVCRGMINSPGSSANVNLLSLILRRLIPRIKITSPPYSHLKFPLPEIITDNDIAADSDDEDENVDAEFIESVSNFGKIPEYNVQPNWNDVKQFATFFPELVAYESYSDIPGSQTSTSLNFSPDTDFDITVTPNKYDFRLDSEEYKKQANLNCKSVGKFNKIAYPQLFGHVKIPDECLFNRKEINFKKQILQDVKRVLEPDEIINKVCYDIDSQYKKHEHFNEVLNCDDIEYLENNSTDNSSEKNDLQFNSIFECGNLKKAIKIRENEYDLILNSDINTNSHHHWFYFEVKKMSSKIPYVLNIINCEKLNSQFNYGMQPVMMSVKDSLQNGKPSWKRSGSNIYYYKNQYEYLVGDNFKSYYTVTFTIDFPYDDDVCYIAYHYPYSYTYLRTSLVNWTERAKKIGDSIFYDLQPFCKTLGGNDLFVMTITAKPITKDNVGLEQFLSRPYIFLSARVHPGEANSSYVMHGIIDHLLSDSAKKLRETFIFKLIPMLNPDGVLNGNHRCGLSGEDLNRHWDNPISNLHPTIFNTKCLLQYLVAIGKRPLIFCDIHGHSRRKNVFLYGCNPKESYIPSDIYNPCTTGDKLEDYGYRTLPKILDYYAPTFSIANCVFSVDKGKEGCARVVAWRQFGIVRAYTMEASYCGIDQGPFKNKQMNTNHLANMGRIFTECLLKLQYHRQFSACPLDPNIIYSEPVFLDESIAISLDNDQEESDLMSEEGEFEEEFLVDEFDDTNDVDEPESYPSTELS